MSSILKRGRSKARYYDPSIGRFLSEDLIDFGGGTNFYTYVFNNPGLLLDPFGLCPLTRDQRLLLAGRGLLNLLIGTGKVSGGVYLTGQTGGLATAAGVYGVVNGFGNLGAGMAQLTGAVTGDDTGVQEAAEAAAVATSAVGVTALVTTGNLHTSAVIQQIEGTFTSPLRSGLTGEAPNLVDTVDTIQNGVDLATGQSAGSCSARRPSPCPQ